MADFFVPSNLFQGRGSAESPGTGLALGDIPVGNPLGAPGYDFIPNDSQPDPGAGPPTGGINHMSLGVLASDADGDTTKEQPAAMLAAFQRIGAGGGVFRAAVQGGPAIEVPQCAFAAPNASGQFTIAPSDVGNGPGQVPPDPLAWSREILAPHVSVFLRNASHCRGVVSQLDGGTDAGQTNSAAPSVQVYVANVQPVWSRWVLLIDGAAQVVTFKHEDSSGNAIDERRPRDIWAQIVVPELQRRIAQAAPMPVYKSAGGGTLVSRGFVSRLNFTSYARFAGYDDAANTGLQPLYIVA